MKKDLEKIINNIYKNDGIFPSFEDIAKVLIPFNFKEEELENFKNTYYKEIVEKNLLDKKNLEKLILNIKIDKMIYPSFLDIKKIFSRLNFIKDSDYDLIFTNYKDIILNIVENKDFLKNESNFLKTYNGFYFSPDEFIKIIFNIEFLTIEFKETIKNNYKKFLINIISDKDSFNEILLTIFNRIGYYPSLKEFEEEFSIKEILKLINAEQKKKIGLFMKINFSNFILFGDNYKKIVKKVFEENGKLALLKNLEKLESWKIYIDGLNENIRKEYDEKVLLYIVEFMSIVKNINKGRKLLYEYIKDIPEKVIEFSKLHYNGDYNNLNYNNLGKEIAIGIRDVENELLKNQEGGRYSFATGKTSEAFWKFRFAFLPGIDKFL